MAKTATATTKSPLEYAQGQPITREKILALIQAANWVILNRCETHLSMTFAGDNWDDFSAMTGASGTAGQSRAACTTGNIKFSGIKAIYTDVYIDSDSVVNRQLRFGLDAILTGTKELVMTVVVRNADTGTTATTTVTVTSSYTEATGTIDLDIPGPGWNQVELSFLDTGSGNLKVRALRIQETFISSASDIPDPSSEIVTDNTLDIVTDSLFEYVYTGT